MNWESIGREIAFAEENPHCRCPHGLVIIARIMATSHFTGSERSDHDVDYMSIRSALRYLGWSLDELGKEMCTCADLRPRGGRNDVMVIPTWAVWRRMAILAVDEIKRRLQVYKTKMCARDYEWIPYRQAARRCRVKWQKVYWLCKKDRIPTKSANKNPARRRKRYFIRIVDLKDYLRESAKGSPNTDMLYKEAYEVAPPHVKNALPKP
jgi:hypothetical protein